MRTKPKINVVIFGKFFGFGNWVDGIWLLRAVMYAVVSCVNHVWQECGKLLVLAVRSGKYITNVGYYMVIIWLLYGYYMVIILFLVIFKHKKIKVSIS